MATCCRAKVSCLTEVPERTSCTVTGLDVCIVGQEFVTAGTLISSFAASARPPRQCLDATTGEEGGNASIRRDNGGERAFCAVGDIWHFLARKHLLNKPRPSRSTASQHLGVR